ncbi:MAG: TetR/AcrR family transcriptional regulator [Planctomycetota bacterium]|nr:TetR/AcrR family transcriptional regulator [Planctomycetota bacterium]
MPRKSSRDAILDAVEKVIATHGITQVTLELVAKEAEISKGGLLYHFANKRELMFRMLERHVERFDALTQAIKDSLPPSPGRDLKAYMLARLRDTSRKNISVTKLVGLLDDPDLKNFVTEIKKREFQKIAVKGGDPDRIALLLLAMEGLWMMDMFQIPAFTRKFRDRLEKRLLRMVDGE